MDHLLSQAYEILAQRPPADRPAWTWAQQKVLWQMINQPREVTSCAISTAAEGAPD